MVCVNKAALVPHALAPEVQLILHCVFFFRLLQQHVLLLYFFVFYADRNYSCFYAIL